MTEQPPEPSFPLSADCIELPNGFRLYWNPNQAGGRTYWSDEIGGGVCAWDTCLVDQSTLLAAMAQEAKLQRMERHAREAEEREEEDDA